MNSWFYAIGLDKHGPVSAAQLADLSRKGGLHAEDLAWREGLPGWQPFRRVAGEVFTEAAGVGEADAKPIETSVCAFSGRALPVSELVPYGDRFVDPLHKDAFVQQLMETGNTGFAKDDDRDFQFMGFWWRALGWIIDNLVVMIPSLLCMLPYIIASFGSGAAGAFDPEDPNPFAGWTVAIVITYFLGLVGQLAVNAFYHTWMLVKYQGTVGKLTIGAKVVVADGSRIGGGRAFCRWLCLHWLNQTIWVIGIGIGFGIGILIMVAAGVASGGSENPGGIIGGIIAMVIFGGGGMVLGLFPYWMAAKDPEKRTLHDRICSTRVVRK